MLCATVASTSAGVFEAARECRTFNWSFERIVVASELSACGGRGAGADGGGSQSGSCGRNDDMYVGMISEWDVVTGPSVEVPCSVPWMARTGCSVPWIRTGWLECGVDGILAVVPGRFLSGRE